MKNKKIIVMLMCLILIGACRRLEKSEVVIDNNDVYRLTFFDAVGKNNMLYTTNSNSIRVHKGRKKTLGKKIVGEISAGKKYYVVEKKGKKGLVDRNLKEIVNYIYDDIFSLGENFIGGRIGDKNYLIDINKYEIIGNFDSLSLVNDGKIIQVGKAGKIVYLNSFGEKIKELDKYEVFFFRDNMAITKKGNLFGLYNLETGEHFPEINEEIYFSGKNILVKREGKYYLNNNPLDIERFYPTMNDVVIYDYKGGFGLLNLRDNKFYTNIYDEVAPYYDRYMIVGKNGKYDIMDKYEEKELAYPYDYVLKLGKNSFMAGTEKENSFALIIDGKKVTEEKYENISIISENYYLGEKDNKIFLIDRNGYEKVECEKKDIIYYNDRVFIVNEDEKEHLYLLEEVKR